MRKALWLAVFAAAFAMLPVWAEDGPAPGDGVDHDHEAHPGADIPLESLSPEQRHRLRGLYDHLLCSCPRENWTRTLSGCPDACASPQKQEVLVALVAGRSDGEIVEEQKRLYSPRVLAAPPFEGAGILVYVLPFVALLLGGALVAVVLRRLRPARATTAPGSGAPKKPGLDPREVAAVERELEELE